MNFIEEAIRNPNQKATVEFIEAELQEMDNYIRWYEQKYNTVLIGDRASFAQARNDWALMSNAQVIYMVSMWKKGIDERYRNQ